MSVTLVKALVVTDANAQRFSGVDSFKGLTFLEARDLIEEDPEAVLGKRVLGGFLELFDVTGDHSTLDFHLAVVDGAENEEAAFVEWMAVLVRNKAQ